MFEIDLQLFGGRGGGSGTGGSTGGGDTGPFHKFTDMPSGTHEFSGDGSKTAKWFEEHSNCDELIAQIENDSDASSAFSEWMSGTFMRGQQWAGWDNMGRWVQDATRQFDKYLDRAKLDTGVVLSRLSTPELVLGRGRTRIWDIDELKAMEGKEILAKGSMSTAAAARGLTIGESNKQVEYKMQIPGGSVGAGMWIGDYRIGAWGPDQREFMTNRDTRWRVGKTTYDSARDIYVVELKYTGRNEHDYGRSKR